MGSHTLTGKAAYIWICPQLAKVEPTQGGVVVVIERFLHEFLFN